MLINEQKKIFACFCITFCPFVQFDEKSAPKAMRVSCFRGFDINCLQDLFAANSLMF